MDTPIIETSFMGYRARVYQNRVEYRPFFFMGTETIPARQIASIKPGMAGLQQVTVETAGGKTYKIVVRLRDKDRLVSAIKSIL